MKSKNLNSPFNTRKLYLSFLILFLGLLIWFFGILFGFKTRAQESQISPLPQQTQVNSIEMPQIEPHKDPTLWDSISSLYEDRNSSPALLAPTQKNEELAILLDGKTGYVKVPHSASLNISSKFTIEAWIKPSETGKTLGIIEKYQTGTGGFSLSIAPQGVLQFSFASDGDNKSGNSFSGSSVVAINEWHHIACTFSGKTLSIYLDGKLDSQQEVGDRPALNTAELTIGLARDEAGKNQFFGGLLDEVRISNTIRYTGDFKPGSTLGGGGILGLTAGCWRFTNQKLDDSTGNNNNGTIVGNVTFIKELNNKERVDEDTQNQAKQFSPQSLINFDNVPRNTNLHNVYTGVSFYQNNGVPMYAYDTNCNNPINPNWPPIECPGQSPHNAARALFGDQPVVFNFAEPANISNFNVLAVDSFSGFISQGAMKQDGVWYAFYLVSNGYNAPVNVHINQFTCGQDPCNRVTNVYIYNIADLSGFVYDDLNYTTYTSPTPNPTPNCLNGKNEESVAPCPPSPTPTPNPQAPNTPYNIKATNDKGEVNISWSFTTTEANRNPATGYKVYKSDNANGPFTELKNITDKYVVKFPDMAISNKIGENKYYRVTAYNQYGESAPTSVVNGSPLSACYDPTNTKTRPTGNFPFDSREGWKGYYNFEHGFSVYDVSLDNRYMAVHIGVPSVRLQYFDGANKNINLDLDNPDSQDGWYSKFVDSVTPTPTNQTVAGAVYCVSTPSGQESYTVSIEYYFNGELFDDPCEPTSGLPCARFYPQIYVTYNSDDKFQISFEKRKENVENLRVRQRLHYRENNNPQNVLALVQDCDTSIPEISLYSLSNKINKCLSANFPVSKIGTISPVKSEASIPIFWTAKRQGEIAEWKDVNTGLAVRSEKGYPDNLHQTTGGQFTLPGPFNNDDFSLNGCPTCIHDHWRWTSSLQRYLPPATFRIYHNEGTFSGRHLVGIRYRRDKVIGEDYYYGDEPSFPSGRSMFGFISVVKYRPEEFNLLLPPINNEKIYNDVKYENNTIPNRGDDIVDWYEVGIQKADIVLDSGVRKFSELFHAHSGFYQPTRGRFKQLNVTTDIPSNNAIATKVIAENYFRHISTTAPEGVNAYSLDLCPPQTCIPAIYTLPPGYTRIPGSGYKITVAGRPGLFNFFKFEQATSGRQIVRFSIPNTNIPFGNIRILHSETDDLEPDVRKWIDKTVTTGQYAPDAANRIISADVSTLGSFTLATVNPAIQQITPASTDLKLVGGVAPVSVASGTNATYTFTVTNQGGSTASNVIFKQDLASSTDLISAVPSTGFCHTGDGEPITSLHESTESGSVYCKTGDLQAGASVSISIVVKTTAFGDGVQTTPVPVESASRVFAEGASDTNPSDNEITTTFNLIPSTNKPPIVQITSPTQDSVFVTSAENPVTIPVSINATDPDGSISEVRVFESGVQVGTAVAGGNGLFTFNYTTTKTGYNTVSVMAVDNGGRDSALNVRQILVNSPHTISIVSPTQQLLTPGATITIETSASLAGNRLQKIEVFDQELLVGKLRQVANTGNIYTHRISVPNISRGNHTFRAILTDITGATTISQPMNLKVTVLPTITITAPNDSSNSQSGSSIDITTQVGDTDGYVKEVNFYANGKLIGTKNDSIVSGSITFRWINPDDGVYSIVATATDDTDETTTSGFINIGVNRPSPTVGEMIWMDDNLPDGATAVAGVDNWNWLNNNPVALLGNAAHQSILRAGLHEHYFENSSFKLQLNAGEQLSTWIFIDPDYAPSEIMLQFKDEQGWEHRAYWGQNLINLGTDGSNSRRQISSSIPAVGKWIQLKVPANLVGLEGKLVNGVKFTLYDGRAAWDRVGKLLANAPTLPSEQDFIWMDDAPPPGSLLEASDDTWTDGTWITSNPSPQSGTKSHRHYDQDNNVRYRQHSFRNAPSTMVVNPGDTLFTYVYIYPTATYRPDSLVLQWYDDVSGWGHRAYWGRDISDEIGFGQRGAESWRYMGPVPAAGQWVRLEIPASYVGLEGKNVKGMAFGMYQKNKQGRAVWDYSGKTTSSASPGIPPLSFKTPIYRVPCLSGYRYYLMTTNKDVPQFNNDCTASSIAGYIYGVQMPGTVPLYIFDSATSSNRRFYSTCPDAACHSGYPTLVGVAGFVPDGLNVDTVQWRIYSCENSYFFTRNIFPDVPAQSCSFAGLSSFVHPSGYNP